MSIVKETTSTDFTRISYFTPGVGEHIVRFIDGDENSILSVPSHWFKGSVACLGDECPQCNLNSKIRLDNPDDFYNTPGYRPRSYRYIANVLIRSEVKVCPECATENGKVYGNFPPTCQKCKTLLTSVHPTKLNDVRVLTKGPETFRQLDRMNSSHLIDGELVGVRNFDIRMVVISKDAAPMLEPAPVSEPVDFDSLDVYDLTTVIPQVSADEMEQLMRGTTLRDIYVQRSVEASSSEADEVSDVDAEAIAKSLIK